MKRNIIISVGLIVFVAVAALLSHAHHKQSSVSNTTATSKTNTPSSSQNTATAAPVTNQTATAGQTASNLSYNDALKIYGPTGSNFRFQFTANCQGTPTRLVIKKGQKFMIDNRDTVAHTIAFGSESLHLNKYGFAIVTASQTGVLPVKCDGTERVTLTVES